MIEVDVVGSALARGRIDEHDVRALCELAARHLGVRGGHVAVQFVDSAEIARLNREHLGGEGATDVLSFPVDAREPVAVEQARELGDVVICPAHAGELREVLVHGMLHLLGMDHERDDGEMLALQRELLGR